MASNPRLADGPVDHAPVIITEQTPLLANASAHQHQHQHLRATYRRPVVVACFLLIFIVEIAVSTFVTASTAVLERNICHAEHPGLDAGGDYDICKDPKVQGRLAMLQGWQMTAESLPGIIGAIPYGILADKWGRRPVVTLSFSGYTLYILFMVMVLYFPNVFVPEAILIGPVFALIGGSTIVTSAMAYTMIADVVPVNDRATVFFQFGAVFAVAELISSPLAGAMMLKSEWLCITVAVTLWIIANIGCFFVPETLDIRRALDEQNITANHSDGEEIECDTDAPYNDNNKSKPRSFFGIATDRIRGSTHEVVDFIQANRGLALLMMTLFFVVLSRVVQTLLLQFTTKKFHWSWSQAAFLLTIRSASNLVTALVVLPVISKLLTIKLKTPAVVKDAMIARWTGVAGILGALIIAFAPDPWTLSAGLVVFGLAGGMAVAVRSLLNALVESHHVGMLNTVLGLLETLGLMVAGPLFSKSLKTGIQLGGAWTGLPFLVAALYMVVATVIVFLYRVPKTALGGEEDETEHEEHEEDDDE